MPVNMLFSNLKDVMFGMMLNSAGMVPVSCRQASAVSGSVYDEHHSKLGSWAQLRCLILTLRQQERVARASSGTVLLDAQRQRCAVTASNMRWNQLRL